MSVLPVLLILGVTSSTATTFDLYGEKETYGTSAPETARGWDVPPGIEPEDAILFVPRALLFPIEWTLFAVFWPIEKLLWALEEYAIIEHVVDFLYNDERTAGIIPSILFVPGQGFSGGVSLFHNDLFGHDESLSFGARFGGLFQQSYDLSFAADHLAGTSVWLEMQARFEVRPHLRYFGIGDQLGEEARFSQNRVLGRFRIGQTFGHPQKYVKLGAAMTYNRRRFGEAKSLSGDQQSIENVYDTSQIVGFDQGIDLVELSGDLVVDFRDRPGFTSSGFYFDGFGGGAPRQGGYGFAHWGAEAIAFVDLYNRMRVLVFRAGIEAVDAEQDRIPFTELPRAGGAAILRGYPLDSFREKKLLFAAVEYRWRIHQNLEASAFFDAAQVAHDYADLFDDDGWHFGGGGGLSLGGDDGRALSLQIGFGKSLQIFITGSFDAFADRTEEL